MTMTAAKWRQGGTFALIVVSIIAAGRLLTTPASTWKWDQHSIHGILEGFGVFTALTVAGLICLLRGYGHLLPAHHWLASGLIGMGLLNGIHGTIQAGEPFVWLHCAATVVGGLLFACVWLPQSVGTHRAVGMLPGVMIIFSVALGVCLLAYPLPPALRATQSFTFIPRMLNGVGGAGFLAAAVYFGVAWLRTRQPDALIWTSPCLLFGCVSVVFAQSSLWDRNWWLWHVLQAVAYGVILYHFFVLYHRGLVALQQSRELLQRRVEARTEALARANADLEQEVGERRLAEQRLLVTLGSIADGVITTDTNRQITHLNRAAEDLTGWREQDALGRPLADVFRIVDAHTRTPVADPTARALATERAESVGDDRLLMSRDGTERVIAESHATIQSESGETSGVVLVFRDVTEVRLRQKEQERLLRDLSTRVKELDCLFNLRRLIEDPGLSPAEILARAVHLLPSAWQYPDLAVARIRFDDQVFETAPCSERGLAIAADLEVRGARVGDVSVGYCSQPPGDATELFPKEEHDLLGAFAERLGRVIERVQAETALRESNDRYRTLVENLPQRVYLKDRDCNFVSCNEAFARDLGIPAEEIRGRATHDLFAAAVSDEEVAHDRQVMASGQTREFDETRTQDGRERRIRTLKTPVKDGQGSVTGVLTLFWDVTDRWQAEEALRQSRRELAIRNRIAGSFLTISDDDMYSDVLKVVLNVLESEYGAFGYIAEDGSLVVPTLTRHIWDKCQVPDKRIVFPRNTWGNSSWPRAIRERRTIYSNEPSTGFPAGHIAISRHVSQPIIHQDVVIGLIQVANKPVDYTPDDTRMLETIAHTIAPVLSARLQRERQEQARADAERRLAAKAQELARSNTELEQFAYVASHDLKAPLRAIDTLSKWIEEDLKDLLTGEALENMELMRGRVQRLETLLDDLLAYSRAGRVSTEISEVDMEQSVRAVVELLGLPDGFTVRTSGVLPTFTTAQGPLEQVLRNLINNAVKHHDRSTGTVDVSVADLGDRYEITVADDGPGIPAELRKKAFQMFQTLRPRDESEGSGMGLALVRKLVEWQGGTIRLESGAGGRGAVFRFTWRKDWSVEEVDA